MSNRRKLIAAGAAAIPGLALEASGWAFPPAPEDPECRRPRRGPNAGYFPNVVLTSHEGERALFYDDLLLGKTVLIHCMSIAGDTDYPVIDNVARVQPYLGERLGRDEGPVPDNHYQRRSSTSVVSHFQADHRFQWQRAYSRRGEIA